MFSHDQAHTSMFIHTQTNQISALAMYKQDFSSFFNKEKIFLSIHKVLYTLCFVRRKILAADMYIQRERERERQTETETERERERETER